MLHLSSADDDIISIGLNKKWGYSIRCLKDSFAGVIDFKLKSEKEIVKIVDLMGRQTEIRSNEILIYIYSDGSTEKVFKVD